MKARFLIENPDEVEFTLKLTMTAKEWDELRDQLQRAHGAVNTLPGRRLSLAITSALTSVRKAHYGEQPA
jgi:hypothetical protein